jgi:phosphoglycerol transferase MdoB-like AlkP superfamily enzyme
MRELCGLLVDGVPGVAAAKRLGEACLPARLQREGYATLGVHGNVRQFYNRMRVYPMFGFGKTMFLDDFTARRGTMELCEDDAFSGVCDRAAVAEALQFIAAQPRAFAHVMTLQSHFPLVESDLGTADCTRYPELAQPDLCLYANQQSEVLRRIGQQLRGTTAPPDVVYIYGDHAPPFALESLRGAFAQGKVPYLVLTRK